jgi:hypothetical protein
MKNCFFLFVACILWAVGANGQTLNGHLLNAEPQIFVMPDHPQHASQTGLAQEQDLRRKADVGPNATASLCTYCRFGTHPER